MDQIGEMKSPAEVIGGRLLREIEREEGSLEDLLQDLLRTQPIQPSKTGIPELDSLWKNNGYPKLAIFGRGLPLLYHLIYHQIRNLNGTLALLDAAGTFSPSHLIGDGKLIKEELKHIHVFRPNKANLKATLDSLEEYMMWGEGSEGSRGRVWVATLVNGGIGGDFNVAWRGWLRVERNGSEREGFGYGISVEEAIAERRRRIDGGTGTGGVSWRAVSEAGEFRWKAS